MPPACVRAHLLHAVPLGSRRAVDRLLWIGLVIDAVEGYHVVEQSRELRALVGMQRRLNEWSKDVAKHLLEVAHLRRTLVRAWAQPLLAPRAYKAHSCRRGGRMVRSAPLCALGWHTCGCPSAPRLPRNKE